MEQVLMSPLKWGL